MADIYRTRRRRLPDKLSLRFVPPSCRPFVMRDGQVVRAAYELCVLTQLRDRLRAGDIWVAESRQYRAFDSYLLPPATFNAMRERGPLPLAIGTNFDSFVAGRRAGLDMTIERVTILARQGELPQVRLDGSGLVISPLKAITPPDAEDRHLASARAGLLDRLVVRHDLASHGAPPLMPFAVMTAVVAIAYPVVIVTRSWPLTAALIAVMLILMTWLVAAFVRMVYCAANPYLSPHWLASARATFGDEVMNPALDQLRSRRSPDDVLERRELGEAIIAYRQDLDSVGRTACGVRLRDAAGLG